MPLGLIFTVTSLLSSKPIYPSIFSNLNIIQLSCYLKIIFYFKKFRAHGMYRIWCMTDIKIEKVVVLALEGPHITIREIIKYTNGPQYAQE